MIVFVFVFANVFPALLLLSAWVSVTRPWQGELLPLLAASNPNPPLIFSIYPFPYKYKYSTNTDTLLAYWQHPTPTHPSSFPSSHFLTNTNTVQIQIHYWQHPTPTHSSSFPSTHFLTKTNTVKIRYITGRIQHQPNPYLSHLPISLKIQIQYKYKYITGLLAVSTLSHPFPLPSTHFLTSTNTVQL